MNVDGVKFLLLLFLVPFSVEGEDVSQHFSHPVDISFMVADVKYSQQRGAQVCEIQHGVDSVFKGEAFSNGGFSHIVENFVNFFSSFDKLSWSFSKGISDALLRARIQEQEQWKTVLSLMQFQKDKDLAAANAQRVFAPESIASYRGFVLAAPGIIHRLDQFFNQPSVILIDRAFLPARRDKYKTSLCWRGDPLVESCKPKWNIYEKKDYKNLAKQMIDDLGSTRFVIKPRSNFCGNGVIIVDKENLNETIQYIFGKSTALKEDPDRAYRTWFYEQSETFLVEEFVPADPVAVPHLGMKQYCPTLRIAFLSIYEQGDVDIYFLGGYYCLPEKPLSDNGTLHEKYKASLETIDSAQVDPETFNTVTSELYEPLRLFYRNMLEAQN